MVKVSRARGMALREAVLDATVAELAVVGPVELSISAVAARADVATSVVYNRFSTKAQLIDEAVGERLVPSDASAATRRPGLPVATTTGAWHQTLLAAAWPGPTQLTVRSALAGRDDSLVPLAAELGSWLLARGLDRRAPAAARRAPLVDLALGRTPTDGPVEPTPRRVRTRAPRVPAAVPLLPLDALGLALLDATGDAVLTDGFARTTVGGIARRAGTSTGAVYNRFSGKGGLLAEAHRHGLPGTVAGRETAMALRVEAFRVAPDDPEVSAAVAATTGRSVTLLAHDLAEAQRDGRTGAELDARVAAWVTASLEVGIWVLARAVGSDLPASASTLASAFGTRAPVSPAGPG